MRSLTLTEKKRGKTERRKTWFNIRLFIKLKMPYELKWQYAFRPVPGQYWVGNRVYSRTYYFYAPGYDYVWKPLPSISLTPEECKLVCDACGFVYSFLMKKYRIVRDSVCLTVGNWFRHTLSTFSLSRDFYRNSAIFLLEIFGMFVRGTYWLFPKKHRKR
jgi:hypothetical protein